MSMIPNAQPLPNGYILVSQPGVQYPPSVYNASLPASGPQVPAPGPQVSPAYPGQHPSGNAPAPQVVQQPANITGQWPSGNLAGTNIGQPISGFTGQWASGNVPSHQVGQPVVSQFPSGNAPRPLNGVGYHAGFPPQAPNPRPAPGPSSRVPQVSNTDRRIIGALDSLVQIASGQRNLLERMVVMMTATKIEKQVGGGGPIRRFRPKQQRNERGGRVAAPKIGLIEKPVLADRKGTASTAQDVPASPEREIVPASPDQENSTVEGGIDLDSGEAAASGSGN